MPGGLDSDVSRSLDDSDVYNYIDMDDNAHPPKIELAFQRYSCQGVACLDPIEAIARKGVAALVVAQIGPDYLFRFLNEGIRVFAGASGKVSDAATQFLSNELKELSKKDFSQAHSKKSR
ncbi:MAG: hypothetical protein OEV21_02205 [Thermoplasmata archaeon]|nr:hypothetical protein [Thermoplasmata archaeon]